MVELALNQKKHDIAIEINEGSATITVKREFPKELLEILKQRITSILPHIKSVEFKAEKKEEKKPEAAKA